MNSAVEYPILPLYIPAGLHQLLYSVTVAILRTQPHDLYDFVTDYFNAKRSARLAGRADWETMDWQPSTTTTNATAESAKDITPTHPAPKLSFSRSGVVQAASTLSMTSNSQILLAKELSRDLQTVQRPSIMRRKSILSSIRSLRSSKADIADDLRETDAFAVSHPKSEDEEQSLRKLLQEIPIFW